MTRIAELSPARLRRPRRLFCVSPRPTKVQCNCDYLGAYLTSSTHPLYLHFQQRIQHTELPLCVVRHLDDDPFLMVRGPRMLGFILIQQKKYCKPTHIPILPNNTRQSASPLKERAIRARTLHKKHILIKQKV